MMKPHTLPKSITGTAPIALLIALIVTPWGSSSSANSRTVHHLSARPVQHASPNSLSAIGDFDGDQRLDQAELHLAGTHRCIHVRFGDSRESHLEFRTAAEVRGALLSRDINRDNKPDLVWLPHYQSEPAVVWLGDGLGHFAKAPGASEDDELRALLFGYPDPELVGANHDEQPYLTPDPPSAELARGANPEAEIHKVLLSAGGNGRRDLGLYLPYLRERGPPLHTSFA